jgi:hypothetical protein
VEAAIFGLVGVLIGAGLNALHGYSMTRRKEKREVRTVARLLLVELEGLEQSLKWALDSPSRDALVGLEMRWWDEHASLLASTLDDGDWRSLHAVHFSLQLFKDELLDEEDDVLTSDDLAHLRITLDVTHDAVARFRNVAGLGRDEKRERIGGPAYQAYLDAGGADPRL